MKRSKEACKNISESKKGKPAHNKGKVYYHNPETFDIVLCEEGKQPDGYERGYGKRKNNKSK